MSILLKQDKMNDNKLYTVKEHKQITKSGSLLYLPRRIYTGEDLDEDSIEALVKNKDDITTALNKPPVEAINNFANNKDV